ncbi:gamma-glutamyl-gamma-aminobutyrate hydrolase family protein [Pseudidiomarina sp.]|uniref:gamma-glutamyl-gamma-aminobutyrate hydrolase family protein n=1 Tax=Pseudidiomarina sp. TaxID=2081707 RepID=UPI00299E468F|nr:gamma-glutamyl-gamma-aminobutyrate hydrolase family protein [Pseudidiomarina sp.]MDX1706056.1 gamma-glutamyl-gamma-aminobutyrate hydrolase family protein [Pseudidiomarina sp.]
MARPRVGVTGDGRRWSPSWWSTRIALWLVGAKAERISVRHQASGKPLQAIIIGGGSDIGPEHYGGDVEAKVKTDPERDELEMEWIQYAFDEEIPLLGICRGAQLINVVLGGNLHNDIRFLRKKTYNRPGVMPTKQVFVEPDSWLAEVCKKTKLRVNSLHHQAIKDAGKGIRVVAHDLDDITQAVERLEHPRVIGVQWHPEYLFYIPAQLRLFRWLISPKNCPQ